MEENSVNNESQVETHRAVVDLEAKHQLFLRTEIKNFYCSYFIIVELFSNKHIQVLSLSVVWFFE